MTLIERCEAVVDEIRRLNQAAGTEDTVQRFHDKVTDLEETYGELVQIVDSISAARDRDLGKPPTKKASTLLKDCLEAKDRVNADIDEALRSRKLTDLARSLRNYSDSLGDWSRKVWEDYVASHGPAADKEVVQLFGQIGMNARQVTKIEARIAKVATIGRKHLVDSDDWTAYDQAIDDINQALDELGAKSLGSAILRFMQDVISPAGAGIDALTDEIRDWIDETGSGSLFRIKPQ